MRALIEISGLDAYYGRAQILHGVGFSVGDGEVTALMGRNGAGKSTTFKSIIGLVADRRGLIRFEGQEIIRLEPHAIARLGLGYVPEDRRIFAGLTVEENLLVGQQPARAGVPTWTPEKIYRLFPNLAEMRKRPGGRMSGGEQQMLAIGRTLMGGACACAIAHPGGGYARFFHLECPPSDFFDKTFKPPQSLSQAPTEP